jgi:hypothetical protein
MLLRASNNEKKVEFQFIFGIQDTGEETNNFDTLNDFELYYNSNNGKYFIVLDPYISRNNDKLYNILIHFADYVFRNNESPLKVDFDVFDLSTYMFDDLFSDKDVVKLYYKFKLFVNGYIKGINNNGKDTN